MDLKYFLGLWSVLRRFVPKFARIVAPLNAKLRKDQPPKIGDSSDLEKNEMTYLLERLISSQILALMKLKGIYTIYTNTWDRKVGWVLLQEQSEGINRTIGYWYSSLNGAEVSYDTTRSELLAVIWAVLVIRAYIEGRSFTIRADDDDLRWIRKMADATGKLARWILSLQEVQFDMVYRAGIKNQTGAALSWLWI